MGRTYNSENNNTRREMGIAEGIKAIRKHPKIGRGSCTTIDECYTDEELRESLREERIFTAKGAVKWALKLEGLRVENATNYRWGEDNDSEIEALRRWEKADNAARAKMAFCSDLSKLIEEAEKHLDIEAIYGLMAAEMSDKSMTDELDHRAGSIAWEKKVMRDCGR